MFKQEGKIGAIRRNVHGKACSCCGSRNYQLVLRSVKQSQVGKLFARCTQCQRPREIDEDFGRILWMWTIGAIVEATHADFHLTVPLCKEKARETQASADRLAYAFRKRRDPARPCWTPLLRTIVARRRALPSET
jgi:hypothetical protein